MKINPNSGMPARQTKDPASADANIASESKLWITWKVDFNKDLTTEEILLEQPAIEDFLNEYLVHQIGGKNKKVSNAFRYVWKRVSTVSNNSGVSTDPAVTRRAAPNIIIYNVEIFASALISSKDLSVPDTPGTIIKLSSGAYTRGIPSGSSKNTVKLSTPSV